MPINERSSPSILRLPYLHPPTSSNLSGAAPPHPSLPTLLDLSILRVLVQVLRGMREIVRLILFLHSKKNIMCSFSSFIKRRGKYLLHVFTWFCSYSKQRWMSNQQHCFFFSLLQANSHMALTLFTSGLHPGFLTFCCSYFCLLFYCVYIVL